MTANIDRLLRAVRRDRLLDTALRLVGVPSRTGEAGACADALAELLTQDGFRVARPAAGHPTAAAVSVRFESGRPGQTVQFNGHLDTVHLPFVPPRVEGDLLRGSGSADMKGGIAAAVEALRALRDADALAGGTLLLTAHDLHESPWGDGSQLDRMIDEGHVGDAVLLPEYLHTCLPVVGRGGLIWKARICRTGPPIHEVMRPRDEPSVIAAGAELVARITRLGERLAGTSDPLAGPETVFVGQFHSGEIFNQYPQECVVEGTRRWLPATKRIDVEDGLRELFAGLARDTGTTVDAELVLMRDAFRLDEEDAFVAAFRGAYAAAGGGSLPTGAKPFCDDGNTFWARTGIPAITHGPKAGGAHTLEEWVSIDDLVRVATVYALTAASYCPKDSGGT